MLFFHSLVVADCDINAFYGTTWGLNILLKVYYDYSVPVQIGLIMNNEVWNYNRKMTQDEHECLKERGAVTRRYHQTTNIIEGESCAVLNGIIVDEKDIASNLRNIVFNEGDSDENNSDDEFVTDDESEDDDQAGPSKKSKL